MLATQPFAAQLRDNLIHRVNVGDSLTRTAARYPDRLAVVDGDRRLTYAEFNAWVNRVAHGLTARGYRRGDALGLASANSVEFLVTYYACAKLGVVCVPVNLGWRTGEVAYVLGHSEARGLAVESQLVPAMAGALADTPGVTDVITLPGTGAEVDRGALGDREVLDFDALAADSAGEPEHFVGDRDPITYLYTSGTTSFPKGVVGNHTAIYLESLTMAFEARLIETERITQIFGLPMMYREMLDHPDIATRDLSSLRRALYAMAPMPEAQLRRAMEVFGCDFYLLFGQTEMSPTATLFRPEHQLSHPGAVGTAVANVQVAIMDEAGKLLPQGEAGEIVYRGPHTMTEYLKNPEATEEAFAHGWFHSGDVGRFDADGLLWFSDRRKDVIQTGGENVASIEVEKAVYAADENVAEVVVVGLPHPRWSEAVTAVVVPRPGAQIDEEKLIASVKQVIDPYKAP